MWSQAVQIDVRFTPHKLSIYMYIPLSSQVVEQFLLFPFRTYYMGKIGREAFPYNINQIKKKHPNGFYLTFGNHEQKRTLFNSAN